jgi:type IX secretion system PorP/SprF family membrane protein
MMKRCIHIIICVLAFIPFANAQDVHFSQFFNSPHLQNPALAGAINSREIFINYRNQWRSVSTPYKTFAAAASGKINSGKSRKGYWAAGGYLYNDQAGDGNLKSFSGNFGLVRHVRIERYQHLGLALSGGFGQRTVNWENFQWGSQYNGNAYVASLPTGEFMMNDAVRYLDVSSGIVWSFNNTKDLIKVTGNNFKQGTIGISAHHLNRPKYGFMESGERLKIKYVLHGDFLLSLKNTPLALGPGFMIYRQGPNQQIMAGSQVRYELFSNSKYTGLKQGGGVSVGCFYRLRDAVVFTGMLEVAQYSFGFSYDMNTSQLVSASGGRGAFEFCVRIVNLNPYFKETKIF